MNILSWKQDCKIDISDIFVHLYTMLYFFFAKCISISGGCIFFKKAESSRNDQLGGEEAFKVIWDIFHSIICIWNCAVLSIILLSFLCLDIFDGQKIAPEKKCLEFHKIHYFCYTKKQQGGPEAWWGFSTHDDHWTQHVATTRSHVQSRI